MERNFVLSTTDTIVVIVYFIAMVGLGILLSKKSEGADDYFLAGRSMTWPIIGFSLFASNISSTTLIGLSGDAYAMGISVFNYEWMAALVLVFFALFMLPFILNANVFTMPEYLEKRYDYRVRLYFAALTLFLNIIVETAASLFAGALVVQMVFPDVPLWQTITIMAILAGGYTIMGGLSAVMITDVIQAVILLIGSVILSYIAFDKIGGIGQLWEQVPAEKLSLVRPMGDPGVPWLGLITGVPLLGFYFWCTNQFMVQRVLSAKDAIHGRKGAILAGFIKLPVLFIMVLPGTAAIILYPELERADLVYPTLVFDLLPVGLVGLVIAGFMAALMSQIDSTLNSASTLVTMDFFRRFNPDLSSAKLMKIGKITAFVIMVLAVLWAPLIENFESLFKYLQTIFAYSVPPVISMFILGAFWKRANASGAFAALVLGSLCGIGLFIAVEILGVIEVHFLYAVPILVLLSVLCIVIGSLVTPPPHKSKTEAYVWTVDYYRQESRLLKDLPWHENYRVWSLMLLVATILLVGYFW